MYAYQSTSARDDGYAVGLYEYTTVCYNSQPILLPPKHVQVIVFAAVFAATLYNGMNTRVWTGWVWFALALGPALLVLYSVSSCVY